MATIRWPPLSISFLLYCFHTLALVLGQKEVPSAFISLSNATDQSALLSFKSLITSDPYNVLSNWNSNISLCQWNGVSCSRGSQRVVALNLTEKALQGILSPYLSNFSFLQVLDLSTNNFLGHLSIDFSRLPWLKFFSVSYNNFEGLIPQTLCRCHHLQFLSTRRNQFHGTIPECLGSLQELQLLNLGHNSLSGTIPVVLANLSKLEALSIDQNQIHGNIPPQLGSLTRLTFLNAEMNNLTGALPETLFNLSALQAMSFAFNQLTGHIPKDAGRFLPNLQKLYLGHNKFDGLLPASLSNATTLQLLSVYSNKLGGPIPLELGSLSQLRSLFLWGNQLTNVPGSHELSIITSLTKCRMLEELDLGTNLLNGNIIPASVGNFTTTLTLLDLQESQIEGTIPPAIANLTKLIALKLGYNRLKGPIPPNIGSMHNLQVLSLSSNALSGSIPPSLYQLAGMANLFVNNNLLIGPISSSINNLTSLQVLILSSNNLSSTIPPSICEMENLLALFLQTNSFTGQLPLDIGHLAKMSAMDISSNKLSGELPLSLSNLQMLEFLNLSKNSFHGHIPEKLDGLVNVQVIDLSYNMLSGEIPKTLETLRYIKVLNLSYNQLEGEIPGGGNLANLSVESFEGNYALCGAPRFHVPLCLEKTKKHNMTINGKKVVVGCVVGGIALLLIGCTIIAMLKYRKKGLLKFDAVETSQGTRLPIISYQELLHATNNFSDANLLGSGSFGSVYKAILTGETTVAVKVLNLFFEGASKSFDVECNVLSQIRHRNLVKVITSCSNTNFKALVLQYMPLGSLEVCLHWGAHQLNLRQRLDIMIDVACALEYLHHNYSEAIIHCDLKPSNVLLDENMTAHVSDFGIAKMIVGHKSSTLTATLGTTGYIAPEFGMAGIVSTKADVYSYGILLLEVFTRTKPTDERFEGDFSLRQWVAEALLVAISDVIDSDLLEEDNSETDPKSTARNEVLVMIMKIGLSCSRESPVERIDMKEVVVALKKIRQKASSSTF